jgi:hypothetical protein
VFLRARREAILILLAFFLWFFWALGASWRLGYHTSSDALELFLGFPSWVFWGVLVPWIAATVWSVAFALRFIGDDDLGAVEDTHEPAEDRGND